MESLRSEHLKDYRPVSGHCFIIQGKELLVSSTIISIVINLTISLICNTMLHSLIASLPGLVYVSEGITVAHLLSEESVSRFLKMLFQCLIKCFLAYIIFKNGCPPAY